MKSAKQNRDENKISKHENLENKSQRKLHVENSTGKLAGMKNLVSKTLRSSLRIPVFKISKECRVTEP